MSTVLLLLYFYSTHGTVRYVQKYLWYRGDFIPYTISEVRTKYSPVVDGGAPRRAGGVAAVGHPAFPAQLLPALSLGRRRCSIKDGNIQRHNNISRRCFVSDLQHSNYTIFFKTLSQRFIQLAKHPPHGVTDTSRTGKKNEEEEEEEDGESRSVTCAEGRVRSAAAGRRRRRRRGAGLAARRGDDGQRRGPQHGDAPRHGGRRGAGAGAGARRRRSLCGRRRRHGGRG